MTADELKAACDRLTSDFMSGGWRSAEQHVADCRAVSRALLTLIFAVREHHAQKADDRCWLDDVKLYQAAGLPVPDNRVGDKLAMLTNCERYIDRRCEGGHWPTYAELEAEIERLRALIPSESNT